MVKYILVSGGVISGIGKGILASSTGLLLKGLGFSVTAIKIDPYLNIDAGTMNPVEHGEVFVLDDGGEVDLDLGNYERYLDTVLTRDNNITTGKIYDQVIQRERRGDYLGKTVQVIPHVTDAIQEWILKVSNQKDANGKKFDVCLIELGGTVGDIESAPFVEAMRQFQFRVGHENFCSIHVSLVPIVGSVGEQKTKPTQASVRDLRGCGLTPDIVACRSSKPLDAGIKNKISMFCHVPPSQVLSVHDCSSIYRVPLVLVEQELPNILMTRFGLTPPASPQSELLLHWSDLAERFDRLFDTVKIVIVGKYTGLHDSYMSIIKALEHASLACNRKLILEWIEAGDLEEIQKEQDPIKYHEAWQVLCSAEGILVPGGFGNRGMEGKILACEYARKNAKPFFGICLGLHAAVIEFARNVIGWKDANSDEFDPSTTHSVIMNMPEISTLQLGGTMRLGARVTKIVKDGCLSQKLYRSKVIKERHRHRYEVNTEYLADFEGNGFHFVGHDENAERMEMVEVADHPYYVAVQFHPELMSRPLRPSPLFMGLILASIGQLDAYLDGEFPVVTYDD